MLLAFDKKKQLFTGRGAGRVPLPRISVSTMLYGAYRLLTGTVGFALPPWLDIRAKYGKEDALRLGERSGKASLPRPEGRLAWFHAASVGESLSILPLVEAVVARGWQVLVTTGTVTSARLMAERLPRPAIHQYIPLDHVPWIRRFLDHWRPDFVLWTESELWPNALGEIATREIPAVLINARLSDRTFRGWRRCPGFAREILAAFAQVVAQSDGDKGRFVALGARRVESAGNLKLAAAPLPADQAELNTLKKLFGKRPRWLGASIHPGEEAIAAGVHLALKPNHPGLLTVLVPRHPQKAEEMARVLTAMDLKVGRRSAGDDISAATDIYIGDTMGELGLFYRLCDLVFMGKSLVAGGGQNPGEAAQLGCALLLGPDMSNFRDLSADLLLRQAAVDVRNAAALTAAVDWLLQDPRTRARFAENARSFMASHADGVAETLAYVAPYLESAEIR